MLCLRFQIKSNAGKIEMKTHVISGSLGSKQYQSQNRPLLVRTVAVLCTKVYITSFKENYTMHRQYTIDKAIYGCGTVFTNMIQFGIVLKYYEVVFVLSKLFACPHLKLEIMIDWNILFSV